VSQTTLVFKRRLWQSKLIVQIRPAQFRKLEPQIYQHQFAAGRNSFINSL